MLIKFELHQQESFKGSSLIVTKTLSACTHNIAKTANKDQPNRCGVPKIPSSMLTKNLRRWRALPLPKQPTRP